MPTVWVVIPQDELRRLDLARMKVYLDVPPPKVVNNPDLWVFDVEAENG